MSPARANGQTPKPFDLGAAESAALAEAEGHPFAFTYKGKRYEVPNQATWPLATLHRFEQGDLEGTLSELLDNEVYEELREAGLRVVGTNRLFEAMSEHAQMSLPNSGPPSVPASTPT